MVRVFGAAAVNTVSIWRFDTPNGADAALRTLERLQTQRVVAIDDAAVVVWPPGTRRPHGYQVGTVAGTVALSGAFWGLLIGLLWLLPLTGPVAGAATLDRVGLPDEFLTRVRDRIVPGTSGLFLLSRDAAPDRIRVAFATPDAEPLISILTLEQEHALHHAFGADDDPADAGR